MKKISILIPCYNEAGNIQAMYECLTALMQNYNEKYDYELIFRDNASVDESVSIIKSVALNDKHVKGIVNSRNYGVSVNKNTFFGRVSGDVIITIACDFQEPPELIPEFIRFWEEGYEIVCGVKTDSQEGKVKYGMRQLFYKIIEHFSDIPQYRNMSGINLRSRKVYELYISSKTDKSMRFFYSDLGYKVKTIPYVQQKRRSEKSSYNLWRSLDFSISSLVSTSTRPLRIATVLGFIMSIISFLVGVIYFVLKFVFWQRYPAGTAPILIGMFFLGSIQLLFIGILGEYIGSILHKVDPQIPPIVTELINYDEPDSDPLYFSMPLEEQ